MTYNQNSAQRSSDNIYFEMMEHIGVLSRRDNGWAKEVNIVAWNGGKGKVDIREWDPSHVRMTKGITLYEDEAEILVKALARRYGVKYDGRRPVRVERREEPSGGQYMQAAPAYGERDTHAAPAREEHGERPREDRPDILFDAEEDGVPFEEPPGELVPEEPPAAEVSGAAQPAQTAAGAMA